MFEYDTVNILINSKLGTWDRNDSHVIKYYFFLNLKWRTAAMLENIQNAITRRPMDQLRRNLGGHIPSCPRYVRRVAHCTFSSYGRLEAECVNQI